jgi:hypothetical protein
VPAAVPLLAATVVAAAIAYGTCLLVFLRLAPVGTAIPQLGRDYYTIMGLGLVAAFGVITVTLPLIRRMTAPQRSASSNPAVRQWGAARQARPPRG